MPAHVLSFRPAIAAALVLISASFCCAGDSASAVAFFEAKIRPLLIENCYECHSHESDEGSGGLYVDTAQSLLKGGSRGPALVPGNVEGSLLVTAIRYHDSDIQMPPKGRLTEAQIQVLEKWIADGALDPRTDAARAEQTAAIDWHDHWASQVPRRAEYSRVDPKASDPIDAAAIERMAIDGIQPAAAVDRATWLRRIYFDLIGLPPSIDEVKRFVESKRPDAMQRVVDELLARPEFGERWGRHWLDVARYADNVGYVLKDKPTRLIGSERYRDWVIRSFNRDLPFDRQVILQLAADRIDPKNEQGDLDAMGFLTVGRKFLGNDDTIDDRIDVMTRGLLGMTVQCARCHDHKFDPIPTTDYYALVGVLASSESREDSASPLALFDRAAPQDHPVWIRGQHGNRGPIAPRQFLTALRRDDSARFHRGSGRLDLAEAIIDDANPLFRRVITNRIWMWLMQHPIVPTPSDFGIRTERPVQANVLDDLATDFAADKSIKRLIRRITSSYLYQQSSHVSDEAIRRDPGNRYLARQTIRRRDFESFRDSVLVVSDHLDRRLTGPPVAITANPAPPRRTVYAFIDRQDIPSVFRVFDVADPNSHSPMRYETIVPLQSLYLMNSNFVLNASRKTVDAALRVAESETGDGAGMDRKIRLLFQQVLQREPTMDELVLAIKFVGSSKPVGSVVLPPEAAWSYGFGKLDEAGRRIIDFAALPVFHEGHWGGGKVLPDTLLDWTSLHAHGGHPGNRVAAVRRWTSPAVGRVAIDGRIGHRSNQGDGVRLSILSAGRPLWQRSVKSGEQRIETFELGVDAGQSIDFAVDCMGSVPHDSFESEFSIRFRPDDGATIEFDSVTDFRGELASRGPERLSRLGQLAQVLLLSNEFIYID